MKNKFPGSKSWLAGFNWRKLAIKTPWTDGNCTGNLRPVRHAKKKRRKKKKKREKRDKYWYIKDKGIDKCLSWKSLVLPWHGQLHVCRTVTDEGHLFSATLILSALAEEQAPSHVMLSLVALLNLDTTSLRSRLKLNSRVTPPIGMLEYLRNSRQKDKKYNDDDEYLTSPLGQRVIAFFFFTTVRRWWQCHQLGRRISPNGRRWTPGWLDPSPHRIVRVHFQQDNAQIDDANCQWTRSRFAGVGIWSSDNRLMKTT